VIKKVIRNTCNDVSQFHCFKKQVDTRGEGANTYHIQMHGGVIKTDVFSDIHRRPLAITIIVILAYK